jgi:hypothetical protein
MELSIKAKMVRHGEDKTINEFAEICQLSPTGYGAIERRESEISKKAEQKIIRGIESLGWEVLDDGVVKRQKTYITLSGNDKVEQLFDDIKKYVGAGGELLIDGADESKTPQSVLETVQRLRKQGMRMRHLIKEGDRQLRAPLEEYRWIPENLYINQAIFIYKNNVALLSIKEDKIFIHRDEVLSRHLRNVFNERWNIYKKPDYTELKDVFEI